jgi:2'-5' RNA ligase
MVTREQDSLHQRWQAYQSLGQLRKHWYWRPGWRAGRSFYTWHLTFDGGTEVHQLVDRMQTELNLPGLDLVPQEGLHLTMQGVGFTDEISDDAISPLVQAARDRCRQVAAFKITLGPVDPDAEGIGLLVDPWAPVEHLRRVIRDAIGSVRGDVPEPEEGFRPHVTIAYSGADVPPEEIRSRLAALRNLPPAVTEVRQVQLIALRRDERVYRWDVAATVPLGGEGAVGRRR